MTTIRQSGKPKNAPMNGSFGPVPCRWLSLAKAVDALDIVTHDCDALTTIRENFNKVPALPDQLGGNSE